MSDYAIVNDAGLVIFTNLDERDARAQAAEVNAMRQKIAGFIFPRWYAVPAKVGDEIGRVCSRLRTEAAAALERDVAVHVATILDDWLAESPETVGYES